MNRALPIFLCRAGVVASRYASPQLPSTLLKEKANAGVRVATAYSYSIRTFANKPFAVDAPDGESDAELADEIKDANEIIDGKPKKVPKDAPFAVDSPDGESDAELKGDIEEAQHIIDEAATLEDKDKIEKNHELEEDVEKFHAKDPERDW